MATDTFGIPLAFAIVAAITLWIVISTRGKWWLKAAVVLLTLTFSIVLWNSLVTLQGWPVETDMPPRFEIKWTHTAEPNKKTGSAGAIYVWAVDLAPRTGRRKPLYMRLHRKGESSEPRIYRLAYSRPLHEQAEEIQQMIMGGGRFFASMKKGIPIKAGAGRKRSGKMGRAEGEALSDSGGSDAAKAASYATHQDYFFHELPPPRFPEKTGP
jgi:hypothetical protein